MNNNVNNIALNIAVHSQPELEERIKDHDSLYPNIKDVCNVSSDAEFYTEQALSIVEIALSHCKNKALDTDCVDKDLSADTHDQQIKKMNLTICRECGKDVSPRAKSCPSCGISNPAVSKHRSSILKKILAAIIYVIGGLVVIGIIGPAVIGNFGLSGKAKCKLLNNSFHEDVFWAQGKPDAGYRYNISIQNIGDKGEITIFAKLSTSEGEFKREQTLVLENNEVRNLSFAFPEPTINASNIQGTVVCQP